VTYQVDGFVRRFIIWRHISERCRAGATGKHDKQP